MNSIKKYFILQKIAIFFGIVFVIFFAGGCSFKYMDWQYYKAKYLYEHESGVYIYDEKLYEEARDIGFSKPLSNGYMLEMNGFQEINTNNRRITKDIYREYFYTDTKGKKYIISQLVGFGYTNYGFFVSGDEGRGFRFHLSKSIGNTRTSIKFIFKDNKWVKIEN